VSSWHGKSRGGVWGYKFFTVVLKNLGLSFAYFFLRFVVIYFILFSPKSLKSSFHYFYSILGYNKIQSVVKIFKNYFIFGQILLDKAAIMSGFKTNLTFDFEGEEHLRKMVEDKTGGLLISAHIGNFEIAGYLLKRLNTKINIVIFDAEHQQIKQYFSDILLIKHVNVILIKNDFSHVYEISNAFKNKEIVCLHGDRFVEGSKTILCNFFGREAYFPTGPFYLAAKFKVPVSFVFAMKETKNHYHFYGSSLRRFEYPANLIKRNEVLTGIVNDYILELEKIIKKYPEQWFNYYMFWKKS